MQRVGVQSHIDPAGLGVRLGDQELREPSEHRIQEEEQLPFVDEAVVLKAEDVDDAAQKRVVVGFGQEHDDGVELGRVDPFYVKGAVLSPRVSIRVKISFKTCLFCEISSMESVLVKYRGKGAVLFFDSLFMICLKVYWYPEWWGEYIRCRAR